MYPSYAEFYEDLQAARNKKLFENRAKDILSKKATDIMKPKVIVIAEDDSIMDACSKLILNKIRRLPVVDKNGTFVGLISQGDLFAALMKKGLM